MYIESKTYGIRINILVPIGLVFVFLLNGVKATAVMFAAAVAHEAGHILCAIAVKSPIVRFDIELWGGKMFYGGMTSYRQEAVIASGGIIANLFLAPIGLIPIFGLYGKLFFYSCISYALVNLIPAKTFDGGELLRCFICINSNGQSIEAAERAVHLLSTLFVSLAGIALSIISGFNFSVIFICLFTIVLTFLDC